MTVRLSRGGADQTGRAVFRAEALTKVYRTGEVLVHALRGVDLELYRDFFRFPYLFFRRDPDVFVLAGLVTLAAALLGPLRAVARAVRLPPAVAMAPPTPPRFRRHWYDRIGLGRRLSQPSLMIVRRLTRWPVRAGLSVLGLALGGGILVGTMFFVEAIDHMIDVTFFRTEDSDATIVLGEIENDGVVDEALRLPGVLSAEPSRRVAVRLHAGARSERTALYGRAPDNQLSRLLDADLDPVRVPEFGLLLPEQLALMLDVGLGDRVRAEVLEGRHPVLDLPVTGITGGYIGIEASMDLAALNDALGDPPVVSPVDLAEIGRGPLRVTVDEDGETRVRDVYVVSAPVDGRLLRVESEVGDRVRAGQTVLASIQPQAPTFLDRRARKAAEARLGAARAAIVLGEAQVQRAAAELDFARTSLRRVEALFRSENVSEEARDRARLEVAIRAAALSEAEAQLQVFREDLARAQADLIEPVIDGDTGFDPDACCVEIIAPVDGTVLAVHRKSEQVVQAGTPVLDIGNPDDLEIVADLLSTDAVKVESGAPATVEAWGGGDVLRARVRRVEPAGYTKVSALGIEEQRVDVVLDFTGEGERRESLGHGYRVEVRITVWQADDVLRVPLAALFRAGDDWAVFVVEDGTAALRRIRIGHRDDRSAEVLSGLEAGERAILHPGDRVEDGVRIIARTGES